MLPSDEKAHFGDIILTPDTKKLLVFEHQNCTEVAQHFYITSDEEIEEGNWCINSYDNRIWKYKLIPCPLPYWGNKDTLTKIIATTDTSLELFRISQQFIEEYIKEYNKGNIITKVEVEYIADYESNSMSIGSLKLKITSHNTINIKPIKDIYNRKEVIKLLNDFGEHVCEQLLGHKLSMTGELYKWCKENL